VSPWLLVIAPLAGAAFGGMVRRAVVIAPALGLVATAAIGVWAAATEAASTVAWGPRFELGLAATDFTRVMVVLIPLIALPIVIYAAATEMIARVRLIVLLTAFVGAMELLVLASDLLTLLLGWEMVGALSWALIAHDTKSSGDAQNATHAFITTRFGDLGLYVAAGIAFASTGSFAFDNLSGAEGTDLQIIAGGVLLAAGAKSAQVPFSPWLFSAMAGPTPVSALLHSSTMVAAGAYLLIRLGPHLDAVSWFAPAVITFGLTSALAGGLVATMQRHPKRLLAASTTAQYGLMFVAVGAGSIFAASVQLVTHAAFKALLFLTAGTAMHEAESDDLGAMRIGRRLPKVALFAGIGVLALAAVPPLGGAWSKEQVAAAAFEWSDALGAAVLGAALLSAVYAFRYWLLAFGGGALRPERPARAPGTSALGFLALASLALGALWLSPVNEATGRFVAGKTLEGNYLELGLALVAIGVAAAYVLMLERRELLLQGGPSSAATKVAAGWFGIPNLSSTVVVVPVLRTSRALATFDDRVIDAGIRASARVASGFSRMLRRRSEISIDALVDGIAGGTLMLATGSRAADDHGVDRGVEGVALGIGRTGSVLRRMQTGLSHHYYVIVAIGIVVLLAALAVGTS
jgi:NADH-quinone oxidoreductase subunit L